MSEVHKTPEEIAANSSPSYTDLCKLIEDAPKTWAPGLMARALADAKRKKVFKDDESLLRFAASVVNNTKQE